MRKNLTFFAGVLFLVLAATCLAAPEAGSAPPVAIETASPDAESAPLTETEPAAPSPEWKIIKTAFPTDDIVVAGLNVLDFGAQGDGETDCTKAFQDAMDCMGAAGGGTVFVPAGRYVIYGNLLIPVSVTLRGEWQAPSNGNWTVTGTVLMPYCGRGAADGPPFIMVDYCGGIKDLSIWYPEQSSREPVPYPYCLEQKGGDNATFENLTLVNPWQGIRIGPGGNELHYVHNVYGTPLKTGIWYDSTTDIGRLEHVRFSPACWRNSGLPEAPPADDETLDRWLKANGTAIHMLRSDWEYVADVEIDGYQRGFLMTEGDRGSANAQFYNLTLRNCTTAMKVEKTNPFGMAFTKCRFEGIETGVLLSEGFDSTILFSNCILSGNDAFRAEGRGNVLIETCQVERGNLHFFGGAFSLVELTLQSPESRIQIEPDVDGVALAGKDYEKICRAIDNKGEKDIVKQPENVVKLVPIPEYPVLTGRSFRPGRVALEIVPPGSENDALMIQQAMDRMAQAGGGIVFLTAGDYLIKTNLVVPSGIELRGIHDVPHHTMGGGSILHIYPAGDEPAVVLQSACGLRGLSFNYPEQTIPDPKPCPFLLQGRGNDIYIINVNASNPYQFLDLMTHRCDNHFVDYLSGSPLKTGIAIGGGSQNGIVQNMQLNPHYALRLPRKNKLFNRSYKHVPLWEYQKENLDALVVGDCLNQFLYQNFVYGSLYGIRFTKGTGTGAANCISHGHGTDGSKVGVFFDRGDGPVTMINTELVAMSSQNKTAIKLGPDFSDKAALINTLVWGSPDLLADIDSGTLILQNLHAFTHGEGLQIGEGKLQAVNLNFSRNGPHLKTTSRKSRGDLSGVITPGNFKAEMRKAKVETDLMIQR